MAITRRRICWPTPDRVCLQGGCGYCNDSSFRSISTIRNYAEKRDRNDPIEGESYEQAFIWGYQNRFCNAEIKEEV